MKTSSSHNHSYSLLLQGHYKAILPAPLSAEFAITGSKLFSTSSASSPVKYLAFLIMFWSNLSLQNGTTDTTPGQIHNLTHLVFLTSTSINLEIDAIAYLVGLRQCAIEYIFLFLVHIASLSFAQSGIGIMIASFLTFFVGRCSYGNSQGTVEMALCQEICRVRWQKSQSFIYFRPASALDSTQYSCQAPDWKACWANWALYKDCGFDRPSKSKAKVCHSVMLFCKVKVSMSSQRFWIS